MRIFTGQSGQVIALSSFSGGWGMISSWVTLFAPCRFDVPTQSEPVSPPPMTITSLPVGGQRSARRGAYFVVAGIALVLLGQEFHRQPDAG